MNQQYYYYKAFDLVFKSCIEHPDFAPETATDSPDCLITFGPVSKRLIRPDVSGGVFQSQGSRQLLKIENVGRYLIENGNKITIEVIPGSTKREILLFLWASAIAALLHQRGRLIVHSSAIKMGEHSIIFSGASGSGKSTIASAFATRKGALVISDDISAISTDASGYPTVLPGYPILKLWRDSSDKLGLEWNDTRLIRESLNKMIVNVNDRFVQQAVPLRQIYFLSYKNEGPLNIKEITGYKKLELIIEKVFRKNFLKKEKTGTLDVFTEVSKIAPLIRVCSLQRLHGIDRLDETIECIEQDLSKSGLIIPNTV